MTTVTPTISRVEDERNQLIGWTAQWAGLANGQTGVPVNFAGMTDRSVQITGTFGAAGSCAIQGSNDGTNFYTLTNPQGTSLAITTAGISQVTEAVLYFRPNVTAGDGSTALTVTAFFRRLVFP